MFHRMVNAVSRTMLLLCLLCVPTYSIPASPSPRRLNIQNRQDNVISMAVGGSTQNGKFANQDDTSPDTKANIIEKYVSPKSASPVTSSASLKKDFGQLKNHFGSRYKDTSKNPCAKGRESTNSLLHSLATDHADIDDVIRGQSGIDARPVFYNILFRDAFRCKPCQCYFTYHRCIVASCNASIAEINAVLPNDTGQLKIYNSKIQVFQAGNFSQYHNLQELSVTRNKYLDTIANTSHSMQALPIESLDLSLNSIVHIEDNSFDLFPHLLHLNLAGNHITNITTLSFEGLENLQHLNLSQNNISVLINGSLDHFKKLEILDLSGNKIQILFMPGVFSNLVTLHTLLLNGSLKNATSYPNKEMARLTNLVSLSIGGPSNDTILGPEIKYLRRLVKLYVGFSKRKQCHLKVITETFLENVPHLKSVSFSRCKLSHVNVNVYKNVSKLRSLEFISTHPYDIFKALDGLSGLQNSSLKSLSLIGLIAKGCPFICLYKIHAKYVKTLKLKHLDLSDNRIGFMAKEFINDLPQTLKKLVIRGSELTEPALLTDKLLFLKHLETLDLGTYTDPEPSDGSAQIQASNRFSQFQASSGSFQKQSATSVEMTEAYPLKRDATYKPTKALGDFVNPLASGKKSNGRFTNTDNFPEGLPVCRDTNENSTVENNVTNVCAYNYRLEPYQHIQFNETSLKYLLAHRFLEISTRELFSCIGSHWYTSLEYIDLSYCALTSLPENTNLSSWIQAVNLNGNYFKHMSHHVIPQNNSLTYLSLKNNVLGNTLAIKGTQAFMRLHQIAYLDISMNMIYELPKNVFQGLHNLSILIMNNNKLGFINSNFSTTPNLEYLDLRQNSITWISKSTRDDLDIIATNHTLYVELTSNPLPCTCEGLEVLHWIWASNIHFVSNDTLSCIQDGDIVEDMGNIEDRVKTLQRQCAGKLLIIVLCVASLVVVCFLVVFGVMYRFRWQLRYIRHVILSRLVGFKPRESTSSAYKFDAFIVYSNMSRQFVVGDCLQELEVKRGHKLCVDDRDFMPGTLSVSAIVSAIQNSRKTVLILSPDFYNEEFSEYSVKMALMEELYQKRPVLYLCVYRPLPDDEMSKSYDLLMVMKRNNYLEFPPVTETSEGIRQNFWDQLSEMIGRSVANELAGSEETTNG